MKVAEHADIAYQVSWWEGSFQVTAGAGQHCVAGVKAINTAKTGSATRVELQHVWLLFMCGYYSMWP
jgi:hypothetical protein